MRQRILLCAISALATAISTPALACFPYSGPFDFDYGTRAETIVVGRITDYENVQKNCSIPSMLGEVVPLCRYARIFVSVEQVLAGKADRIVSAIVNKHSGGGFTDDPNGLARHIPTGQVLIALEDLSVSLSKYARRKRNSDGSISPLPNPRWGIMTVVEEPCRSAFVFDATSDAARTFLARWQLANSAQQSNERTPPLADPQK